MPKLKQLSGDDVISLLSSYGFSVSGQRGPHVKLTRSVGRGTTQSITFPRVKELDPLALGAIFRHAAQYIPEERLRFRFYTE